MADIAIDADWDDLDRAFEALEAECADVIRGITVQAWNQVLQTTPQFYGRLAASWTYSLNAPISVDRSALIDTEDLFARYAEPVEDDDGLETMTFTGLWQGHPDAIAFANSANAGHDFRFKLGDTVYFTNGADHGEGEYGSDIELGQTKLRDINRPGKMARRAFDLIQSRYGRDVIPSKVVQLKSLQIGISNA